MENNLKKKTLAKRKVEISETGYQKLSEFMAKLNDGVSGKVRVPEVLEYAVQKLRESDIEAIQENYYSPAHKIELLLHKENLARAGEPLTKDQLLASMLAAYQREIAPKPSKGYAREKSPKSDG